MGKVVYSWDDHRHSVFDDTPLQLAAIAGTDSFYYAIADSALMPCAVKGFVADRKYHFFDKPLGYLSKLVAQDSLLCADFTDARIALRGLPFILMNSADFSIPAATRLLSAISDISPSDMILRDSVTEQTSLIFAVPELLVNGVWSWFSGAQISHVMASLIRFALLRKPGHSALVNSSNTLVEIVIVSEGRLRFTNHYRISAAQDVLYYVMAVLEELGMEPGNVEVRCSGYRSNDIRKVLQSGIPDCENLAFPEVIPGQDYPAVETTDLISVLRCAS